jgi:recombination protein RecA
MSKTSLQNLTELVGKVEAEAEKAPVKANTHKPLTNEDKLLALKGVEAQLDKQFSTKNSLIRLGSRVGIKMPHIVTGITSLDEEVFGVGGVPRGRVVEVYGPESAGKTTVTLEIIAAEQRNGGLCAFVDAEHALDPNYAAQLGVDVDNLYVSQPDYGEQALEAVIALVESRAVTIVVVDSVAALVPKAELDGEMGDSHMGLQARLMSQAMRKLVGICAANEVTVIFINQLREKIGVVFGNPETTTGGRALKFYSSVRLDVRRDANGNIKDGDKIIGHRLKIKAAKNKVATPFRETVVNLIYGKGIDRAADLLTYGESLGVIEKSGGWYSYKGDRLGNGLEKAKTSLTTELVNKIKVDIQAALEAKKEKQ